MRTIKRSVLPLNQNKQAMVESLAIAYCKEKKYWLGVLQSWDYQALLGRSREIRDQFVKDGYKSVRGLQARHWKLALEDAISTWDMYWQSLFVEARRKIHQNKNLSEQASHYAYWLLKGYKQFAALMRGGNPLPPFEIDSKDKIASYVRRVIKKLKKKPPTVKTTRIVKFDADCYEVFEKEERQYLKIMTLVKGNRLALPLVGKTKLSGNITLVISDTKIEIHATQDLKKKSPQKNGTIESVDFGYTEVMTDTDNNRYGKQFGEVLSTTSDNLSDTMKKRNKLHAIAKTTKNPSIKKHNLGKKKFNRQMQKNKACLEKEINTAINELIKEKKPNILVTEDLRHVFTYNKSRKMNRRLSAWLRGTLQDRVEFKALAEGFCHEQVNPAYGSQICPHCDFVDHKNRNGDKFRCLYCGHEDVADRVAALNYFRRFADQEIGRYMPYREVKTKQLEKFHRRLEMGEIPMTVPGRTLDTVTCVNPPR
ncbi:MAG: transposase [Chlamydiales bacterium]|nr:transposase [Chlamydiales bacterium]